ncbi:MAG: cbb3-type cytochrome oxidase assembly protein CcoS [Gammaproteobacteria bacterium]|nr:cbb3-type cytochrome oxidase assembly protein CcoS [Gammaproteobacteria bacterium]
MESVYLLIPLSILIGGIAVWPFFWAVDRGQFDDFEQAERLALECAVQQRNEPRIVFLR